MLTSVESDKEKSRSVDRAAEVFHEFGAALTNRECGRSDVKDALRQKEISVLPCEETEN